MIKKALYLSAAMLAFTLTGSAQYGTMSQSEVKDLVKDTHSMAERFEEDLDDALDESIVDDTRAEERNESRADDLEDHLNQAKGEVDDPDDFRKHIDSAMQAAFDVEKLMAQHRFPEDTARDWGLLRGNLNRLAQLVGLQPIAATAAN
jgi:hypothetical protein